MNLKYIFCTALLSFVFFNTNAQDISDVVKKMNFPNDLPTPRFIIALPDTVNGISLRVDDIKSITQQKLNKVKDVEFVEISFGSQIELNKLVALLENFQQVKYVSFKDNKYSTKTSLDTIVIPNDISKYKNIEAIRFSGEWKIDYDKSFAILHELPKLEFFFFENLTQEIPTRLLKFTNLKALSIYNDNSIKFPDWIVGLTNLESLSLSFSQYRNKGDNYLDYSKVFKTLEKFPKLKSLYINSLYSLKEKYADVELKNLEILNIFNGKIENSSQFFKFLSNSKQIASLRLSGLNLDTLHKDITKFKFLKNLIVDGNNQPVAIDFNIKKLTKLENLELRFFKDFPLNIQFPNSLIKLNLSSNRMENLPPNITKLSHLKILKLNYNSFKGLPIGLGNLKKLVDLDLSSNQIVKLPGNIGNLSALKYLDLLANPLIELPFSIGQLQHLSHLDLSYCDLTTLPESFGNLQKLGVLKLESNLLTTLPLSFSKLTNLSYADFKFNNLTSLPIDFWSLINLKYLNLDLNNIAKLPPTIGNLKKLEQLYLTANNLNVLPEEVNALVSLQKIYLSNILSTKQQYYGAREIYRKDYPKPKRVITSNSFQNLPQNLSKWYNLKAISMSNYTTLNDVELFKSLFTIPAKGFSVEIENSNITSFPLTGWTNFNVGVLNLRSNQLSSIPKDIINAPYLVSYNFNNNKLPSKPVNLNSYAGNKYEKLLWFKEFGFIKKDDFPKVDSMVLALVEKSNNHYYRKEFNQSVAYANQAISINKELAFSKIYKQNLGEANYEVGNYLDAINLLTMALKNDTAGNVRIMNSVVPDFEFRAKSYLKLGDTLKAIKDYETLAVNNWSNSWAEVGLLYTSIGDKANAQIAYGKGIKNYQDGIEFGKKQENDVALEQLSLLELLIVSENFTDAEKYAEKLSNEIKNKANLTLLYYLNASTKIGLSKSKDFNEQELLEMISSNKKSISSWSYELFFKWLKITKIGKDKVNQIRKITDSIKPQI